MKSMPYEIKQKLKQLGKAYEKARRLDIEVCQMIEEHGVNIDYLNGCADYYGSKPITEALAYIVNAEGDVSSSINDIEEVFLWHVNNIK